MSTHLLSDAHQASQPSLNFNPARPNESLHLTGTEASSSSYDTSISSHPPLRYSYPPPQ
jgi:hypothetical protein